MRMTQFIGLNSIAREFLGENTRQIPCSPCPHCGKMTSTRMDKEEYEDGRHWGMSDDGPTLHKYRLKDNSTVKEIVQAAPWSSGPCIFLCLKDEQGNQIGDWSQEEIDKA